MTQKLGPSLIAIASMLWATDALVRYPAIHRVDPIFIVLLEHVLAVLILFPWLYWRRRAELFNLSWLEWASAMFCGVFGSAIATLCFTASFAYLNPSVAVLLQKLQPVLVVLVAFFLLGEKPSRKFFIWGSLAVVAAIILSQPDFNWGGGHSSGLTLSSKGLQYTLAAAAFWAISTVAGKSLVKVVAPSIATFWRFFFGLIALVGIRIVTHSAILPDIHIFESFSLVSGLLYLSLVPGLLAMLIYYSGLARTPAGVTAFIELIYPIGAIVLNTLVLHTPLSVVEAVSGFILVWAVTMISL